MKKIMMIKNARKKRRAMRNRKKLRGTAERPRMCVVKTGKHIYIQLIDDEKNLTIATTSTLAKEFRKTEFSKKNRASAKKLGEHIAEIAKEKKIKNAIFDRGSFKYHGILAEIANAAREAGMKL